MNALPRRLAAGDPATVARELRGQLPGARVYAAPGRVNLIGEHLDYNGGRCLPLTLPHACFVAARHRRDGMVALRSRQSPQTWEGRPGDAGPGRLEGWLRYAAGVLWALEQDGLEVPGLDLVVDGRVPTGAGLSSSAALVCAVAVAVAGETGRDVDGTLLDRLLAASIRAENDVVGAPTGGMDQTAALFGRPGDALLVDFATGGRDQVPWRPADQGLVLLVVDTAVTHALDDGGYAARRQECEEATRALGLTRLAEATESDLDRLAGRGLRRARHVVTETRRVTRVVEALRAGRLADVGPELTRSHESLRDDFEVSCEELDVAVETTLAHGALGARMTGGGFGGSAVVLAPADRVAELEQAVAGTFAERGWDAPGFATAGVAVAAGPVETPDPGGP